MRASHFQLSGSAEFLKPRTRVDDQPSMTSTRSTNKAADPRKKRRRRKRRLTDKIRAALARAAALGRRDVTEQLGTLYQERVEEELARQWQRRARDPGFQMRRTRRGH